MTYLDRSILALIIAYEHGLNLERINSSIAKMLKGICPEYLSAWHCIHTIKYANSYEEKKTRGVESRKAVLAKKIDDPLSLQLLMNPTLPLGTYYVTVLRL